jgi:hypothetical protein
MLVVDFAFYLPLVSDDFAENAGGDSWALISSEDRNVKTFLSALQFEWVVQIFELKCDERAIQRDVLRQVMLSYTAILIDMQNLA